MEETEIQTVKIPLTVDIEENIDPSRFRVQIAFSSGNISESGEKVGFWSVGHGVLVKLGKRELWLDLNHLIEKMVQTIEQTESPKN